MRLSCERPYARPIARASGIRPIFFPAPPIRSSADQEVRSHRALALDVELASFAEFILALKPLVGTAGHLDLARQAVRRHPAGRIHRVTPEVVGELAAADHPGDDGTAVHTDPDS